MVTGSPTRADSCVSSVRLTASPPITASSKQHDADPEDDDQHGDDGEEFADHNGGSRVLGF